MEDGGQEEVTERLYTEQDYSETEPGSNFTPASKPDQSAESVDQNTESEESKKEDESKINVSELKLMNSSFDKQMKEKMLVEAH